MSYDEPKPITPSLEEQELREKQQAAAIAWLESKRPGETTPPCTFCGHNKFTVTPQFGVPRFRGTSIKTVFPVFAIFCQNCGHVEFFSSKFAAIDETVAEGGPQ